MKVIYLFLLFTLCTLSSIIPQIVNNNFQVIENNDSAYTLSLQLSINQNTAVLGNSVIRFSYDTSSFYFPQNPKENVDYQFYNLSNTNYYYSVSHPSSNIISINLALLTNSGITISNNSLDIVSIHFKKLKPSDNANLQPVLQQFFSPLSSSLWTLGSWHYSPIPLILSGAAILDSTTVELSFSEQVESNSAQNFSNYSIDNGVTVKSAIVSSNHLKVTLKTTAQIPNKNYTVTVNNVLDTYGNPILKGNNTFQYYYYVDNIPLNILGITVNNNRSITVNFNKRLDPKTAENSSNYSLSNNSQVNQSVILPDSQTVLLKTSTLQKNINYSLTIKNVLDRAGNMMYPNPVLETITLPVKGNGNQKQNPFVNATSSSWVQNYSPANVIDTNGTNPTNSRWLSATPMPDTLFLDMGKIYPLNSLRISFYKWEIGRLYEYSIFSSQDSHTWQPLIKDVWSDSAEWTEVDFDSTNARFIKIVLTQSNQTQWASIWKIEAYGTSTEPNNNLITSIPTKFEISQNYPNPFNPSTKIDYSVPKGSYVRIIIYDILGNKVKELVNGFKNPGNYTVELNASNLTSGIYFYRLQAGNIAETKKMILLK
jgi:Secretion system C-terminal sorting domain/NedA-like, galactose-binding domain/Bacterial Ig-like domain